MKTLITTMLLLALTIGVFAQIYKIKEEGCKIRFFSEAPLENIEANNKLSTSILNTASGEIVFQVPNISFKFEKPLMEEHFNENYMETDKYPKSTFKGKINEKIDFAKDGEYKVTVTGVLNIHGVDMQRTIEGKIIIKNGEIQILTEFMVHVADHKIKIPQLVVQNIAEDVQVYIDCTYEPYKKQ
jgi:hypothetical protein